MPLQYGGGRQPLSILSALTLISSRFLLTAPNVSTKQMCLRQVSLQLTAVVQQLSHAAGHISFHMNENICFNLPPTIRMGFVISPMPVFPATTMCTTLITPIAISTTKIHIVIRILTP